MQFRQTLFIISLICLIFSSSPLCALMLGLSTEKLTRDAELIVTGFVEDTASQWTPDKKSIITTAVVTIKEIIKGKPVEKKIQVMYPGGQVGDIGMKVSDEVILNKGERVLLFLSPDNTFSDGSAYRISGRAQGKYAIGDDLIARKRGFSAASGDEHLDSTLSIESLKEKIRNYVDEN